MNGPTLRELAVQALSSVEHGYDLLAPKFDATPFCTPDPFLAATAAALREKGPFERGLDLCCGTGAGLGMLAEVTAQPPTGVDFSAGMLARARAAHPGADLVRADARALPFGAAYDLVVSFGALGPFLPEERSDLFAGIHRALRPGGLFALPLSRRLRRRDPAYWILSGFDMAMRVRNAVWRPRFVMYYRTHPRPALLADLVAAGFEVSITPMPSGLEPAAEGAGVQSVRRVSGLDGHFVDLKGVSVPVKSRDTRSTGYPSDLILARRPQA